MLNNVIPYFIYNNLSIAYYDQKTKKCNMWKIVTLGEDDAYHFLNSQNLYCSYFGEKSDFLSILSEAISIMNNNI